MTSFNYGALSGRYANGAGLALTATSQALITVQIPINTIIAGSCFRLTLIGALSVASTLTPTLYLGTLGTTGDTVIWAGIASASATGQNLESWTSCTTAGASAVFYNTYEYATNTAGTASAPTLMSNMAAEATAGTVAGNTTTATALTLGLKSGASVTGKIYTCTLECLI